VSDRSLFSGSPYLSGSFCFSDYARSRRSLAVSDPVLLRVSALPPWALTLSGHARCRHSRRSLTALCLTLGWPFRFRTISGPFPDLSCRSLLPQLPFKSLLSISAIFGNTDDHGDSHHPPLPPMYTHFHPRSPSPPKHRQRVAARFRRLRAISAQPSPGIP
jgi:hypothetical protein